MTQKLAHFFVSLFGGITGTLFGKYLIVFFGKFLINYFSVKSRFNIFELIS